MSRITGGLIVPNEEDDVDVDTNGSLFVDCAEHGAYLGYLHLLYKGPEDADGASPLSASLMLIPLKDVEYVSPYGMK